MDDIFRRDVIEQLRDVDWFSRTVALQYADIARSYDCVVLMADDRLIQAHDLFWEDAQRAHENNMPADCTSLDQFKYASYLAFWLRRVVPVREVRPLLTLGDRDAWAKSDDRIAPFVETFILYGNEICALRIAGRLSFYLTLLGLPTPRPFQETMNSFEQQFNGAQVLEFAKILKHKNISAQGLYMTFKMMCRLGRS